MKDLNIPDRVTIRLNSREKSYFNLLATYLHEEDISKIIKSAPKLAFKYLEFVTNDLAPPDYDIVLVKKRKSLPTNRRMY